MKVRIKAVHPLQWIADLFQDETTFVQKKMFGCEAICLDARQMLVLAAKDEPWNGLLVCTARAHHQSLQREFKALKPHSVLGKWLYLSQKHAAFEEVAQALVALALASDPRIGVESTRKIRRTKSRTQ